MSLRTPYSSLLVFLLSAAPVTGWSCFHFHHHQNSCTSGSSQPRFRYEASKSIATRTRRKSTGLATRDASADEETFDHHATATTAAADVVASQPSQQQQRHVVSRRRALTSSIASAVSFVGSVVVGTVEPSQAAVPVDSDNGVLIQKSVDSDRSSSVPTSNHKDNDADNDDSSLSSHEASSASSAPSTSKHMSSPLDNRPYAPVEALLPMTRQRMLLGQALHLAQLWRQSSSSPAQRNPTNDDDNDSHSDSKQGYFVSKLQEILAAPAPIRPRKTAISMTRRYQIDKDIVARQDVDAHGAPSALSGATLRASMNVYTANLRFGESYVLTASPEDKKRYIRTYDRLPDVRQVITADLDLRDLYRNDAQTRLDDASAELYCDHPDPDELVRVLLEAKNAVDQWFALIRKDDVKQAEDVLRAIAAQETNNHKDGTDTASKTKQRRLPQPPNQRFQGVNWWA